jgi:hypothetical protein
MQSYSHYGLAETGRASLISQDAAVTHGCLVSFGLHREIYQPEGLSECIVEFVDARTIRICKKDSHLLRAVSKLRREHRNKKFNRKLRASCECDGREGCGILPMQPSIGMVDRKTFYALA